MFPGFGVAVTCEVLRNIQNADIDAAFWLINKEQTSLQHEKTATDKTLELLENLRLPPLANRELKNLMTIGEAVAFTGVTTSAIRHWEKEGLLIPERDPENGYRLFTPLHIRKILLIRTLRNSVYFLKSMKEIVQAVDHQSIKEAKKVTENALQSIHQRNRHQFRGVHQLIELCEVLELM